MSTSEQEKLNALLARAMYASDTPFSIVENLHWQAFFKAIRPAYVVPSRCVRALTSFRVRKTSRINVDKSC